MHGLIAILVITHNGVKGFLCRSNSIHCGIGVHLKTTGRWLANTRRSWWSSSALAPSWTARQVDIRAIFNKELVAELSAEVHQSAPWIPEPIIKYSCQVTLPNLIDNLSPSSIQQIRAFIMMTYGGITTTPPSVSLEKVKVNNSDTNKRNNKRNVQNRTPSTASKDTEQYCTTLAEQVAKEMLMDRPIAVLCY